MHIYSQLLLVFMAVVIKKKILKVNKETQLWRQTALGAVRPWYR